MIGQLWKFGNDKGSILENPKETNGNNLVSQKISKKYLYMYPILNHRKLVLMDIDNGNQSN